MNETQEEQQAIRERKRLLPDWSPEGWAFAVWTAMVLAAVIVAEVWNALTWTSLSGAEYGPDSAGLAVLAVVFGFFIWLVGWIVGWILLRALGATSDQREFRAYERERKFRAYERERHQ